MGASDLVVNFMTTMKEIGATPNIPLWVVALSIISTISLIALIEYKQRVRGIYGE